MTWALLLQIFAALGGVAGVSALINLLISRKKVAADTVDVGQNTNDKMIKNLQEDNKTLREENQNNRKETAEARKLVEVLYDRIAAVEFESSEQHRLIISLINWSREAWDELCGYGSKIRQPPSMDMLSRRAKPQPNDSGNE